MIKNAEDAGITVNFYDSNIGRSAGSATTSTYKLENVEAKDVTIEDQQLKLHQTMLILKRLWIQH